MKKLISLSILCFLFFSCAKKTDGSAPGTDTPGGPTGVPFTATEAAGNTTGTCVPFGTTRGTALNGNSMVQLLSLNANNTYSANVFFYSGTVCQFGGTSIMTYSQSGTWSTDQLATTPSNATEMIFTVSTSELTIYAGSGIGATWAGYMNSFCPGGPTFNSTGTSTFSIAGRTCSKVSVPDFTLPTFASVGSITYNIGIFAAPINITLGAGQDIFNMGSGIYPTTANVVWTYY
jgi:hypothetical protein